MYQTINATLLAALVLGVSTPVLAEQQTPTGAMLANNCTGCHGSDGVSNGPSIPSIGGLNEEYFVGIMNAYKDGTAYSTIMGRLVKGYSEDEIKAMANFYAKKSFVDAIQKSNTNLAKTGKDLHEKYCETCHEKGGADSSESGILAGQWIPYLQWTIADFKNGKRTVDKKMLKKLEQMFSQKGDEGIDALINYYAAQKK
ncbi:Cytochrome subunit of sulfide dehydrogenase [Gammaproteobacteria bacterium]